MTVFTELDALTSQVQKSKHARDDADEQVNKLAQQLVSAKCDIAKEVALVDQIKAILDILVSHDDAKKIHELNKELCDSENKLKSTCTKPAAK